MARLIIFGDPPATHPIEGVVRIGRHPNCDVQVLDANVSKEHCIIEARSEHFVLRDAGSMNGTYLNGALVSGEARLKHLDIIRIGHACARFDDLAHLAEERAAPDDRRKAPDLAFWIAGAAPRPEAARGAASAPELEEEIRRRQNEILRDLGDEEDPTRLAERALEAICDLSRAEHGALFVRDAATGELTLRASRGGLGSSALVLTMAALAHAMERRAVVATFGAEVRASLAGRADADGAGAEAGARAPLARPARRSALAVPLGHRRCHGVVWVEAPSLERLGPADFGFLEVVGRHAGLLLTALDALQEPPS